MRLKQRLVWPMGFLFFLPVSSQGPGDGWGSPMHIGQVGVQLPRGCQSPVLGSAVDLAQVWSVLVA